MAPETADPQQSQPISSAVHGVVKLDVSDNGLRICEQRAPLRVFLPNVSRQEPPSGVIGNISGGVLGGDILDISVDASSHALITGQAAEKIYRTNGPCAVWRNRLNVKNGAALEWLPQGTILFDQSRLDRRTTVEVAQNAHCLIGEILIFGRSGMGETIQNGFLREAWRIERAGRPVWIDILELNGDIATRLAAPFGMAGARCAATAVYAGNDAAAKLETARAFLPQSGISGATLVNDVLIARWLGQETAEIRTSFAEFWKNFRAEVFARPARMPVLWQT